MQIDIRARGFELTNALRDHAERRLRFALSRAEASLGRVTLRLSDINGPRGGADKHCHLRVALKRLTAVVVEDTQIDLYVAIDRAADRAGRTVERRLARRREHLPTEPNDIESSLPPEPGQPTSSTPQDARK